MSVRHRRPIALAVSAVALALALGAPAPARAQLGRGDLVITVSQSVNPAPSGGEVAYGIAIKNTGRIRAKQVLVTVPLPAGTTFVKCTTTSPTPPPLPCALRDGDVTARFQYIAAHKANKVNLTLKMPSVTKETVVSVFIDANGDQVNDATLTVKTTVLAGTAAATYLPSLRKTTVACGDVLDGAAFGADTTLRMDASLGCASAPVGLRIAASNRTLDLNRMKIIGSSSGAAAKGSVGIAVAAGRTNVTIRGGSTNGTAGIEHFDWCVADEGDNAGLLIETLRCFRARSAGLDLISSGVTVSGSLVDKAVGTSKTTFEPPGGVGIRVTGDNVVIQNTKVRRSKTVGIHVAGADVDGNGVAVTIEGNTSTSRVENNSGIGVLVEGQDLRMKDTLVTGDGTDGLSTNGVVVEATALGTVLNGVQVKNFAANGFVVAAPGARVTRSRVEGVAADGYVITGDGVMVDNNEARAERHGYVLSGADIVGANNLAEDVGGDGFVIDGVRARMDNSEAQGGAGHGFVVTGADAVLNTNSAELNTGDGFHVAGDGGSYGNNRAKANGGVGVQVLGQLNTFSTNLAEGSVGAEWSIGPSNTDSGGNKANGSLCAFGAGPGIQTCE
jgi:uncharacterized repeat protein (TIGR01451 family)